MKTIRYGLEYLLLKLFSLICSMLPTKQASSFGGFIGKMLGPLIDNAQSTKNRIKDRLNIDNADTIYKASWDNLGRNLGEYPHLEKIVQTQIEFKNTEILETLIKDNKPLFFVSGHIGNWELLPVALYKQFNIKMNSLYREPNNPYVAGLLEKMRSLGGILDGIPKSKSGAKELISYMKDQKPIGFLFDQKYNEGDPIPLMGKDAMSYTSFIPLCQKHGYTLLPGYIKRLPNHRFQVTLENPVALIDENGNNRAKEDVFLELNTLLEQWIKETPEGWLWQHKRWGKED